MSIRLVVSAIFFTLLAANTFHPLPGLAIQWNAIMLSIQPMTDLMGHRWRAAQRFFRHVRCNMTFQKLQSGYLSISL